MSRFPTKALILPPILPVAVMAFTWLLDWSGHRFDVHGDILLVIAVFFLLSLIALLVEAVAVPIAWRLLHKHASLRTPRHLIAIGIGALYLLAGAFAIVWYFAKPALIA